MAIYNSLLKLIEIILTYRKTVAGYPVHHRTREAYHRNKVDQAV